MEICKRFHNQTMTGAFFLCLILSLIVCFDTGLAYGEEVETASARQQVETIALGGAAMMLSNSNSEEQSSMIEKAIADTNKKVGIPVEKLLTAKVDVALNVREKPNTECDITGKLYRGGAAEILKKKGKWYQIKSGKVTGWVRQDLVLVKKKAVKYLEKVNPKTARVTGSYVNIRKKGSSSGEVIAVVKEGSGFMCLKKGSEWTKIQVTPDVEGYISTEYVSVKKEYGEAVTSKQLSKYQKALDKKTAERRAKEAAARAAEGDPSSSSVSASGSEFDILAAICEREAGSNYENCVAVANVVLNRVNSSSYPNTISGVVFQSGQFCSRATLSRFLNRGVNSTARSAARAALDGYNNIGSRKSFRWVNAPGAYNHSNCVTIGDNVFF